MTSILRRFSLIAFLTAAAAALPAQAMQATVQVTGFMQGVAEAAAQDREIAEFYRETGYRPVWTSPDAAARERRAALMQALSGVSVHGLPASRYDTAPLQAQLATVRSDRDLGRVEVEFSKLFLRYARDVQTGILTPSSIDPGMVRDVPYTDRATLLRAFSGAAPAAYLKSLPPSAPEYVRLQREKLKFERVVAHGGWGETVRAQKLEPGDTGGAVVALRNRLIAMGYLKRTASATYDSALAQAVAAFQEDHGLLSDGVAGGDTLEAVNISAERRLQQILVAMERERWLNMPLGKRYIWVNITDFHARIVDDGKVTFETRSVVGHRDPDRRTPEFSDVMDHMVLNPTWNVPRSIATQEYLPALQRNPYAAGHLQLVDRRGRVIPREMVGDFRQFNEKNFPFDLKQPPSERNALGLVKFMFPNHYNIYLHDTPEKSLFGREVRAFSHGCIRLNDPFDFAYVLLARQEADPKAYFKRMLSSGRETQVYLTEPVPVHIVYRTAFTRAKGRIQFRADVYGRDALIWDALEAAGVSLGDVQG
jgi:murein L,D-transpeptidase YcbB/YkuD